MSDMLNTIIKDFFRNPPATCLVVYLRASWVLALLLQLPGVQFDYEVEWLVHRCCHVEGSCKSDAALSGHW